MYTTAVTDILLKWVIACAVDRTLRYRHCRHGCSKSPYAWYMQPWVSLSPFCARAAALCKRLLSHPVASKQLLLDIDLWSSEMSSAVIRPFRSLHSGFGKPLYGAVVTQLPSHVPTAGCGKYRQQVRGQKRTTNQGDGKSPVRIQPSGIMLHTASFEVNNEASETVSKARCSMALAPPRIMPELVGANSGALGLWRPLDRVVPGTKVPLGQKLPQTSPQEKPPVQCRVACPDRPADAHHLGRQGRAEDRYRCIYIYIYIEREREIYLYVYR